MQNHRVIRIDSREQVQSWAGNESASICVRELAQRNDGSKGLK